MYLRLRQLCLVAEELEPVVDDLCAIFGVTVCHRDPEVRQFGLHNALMPFGTSFVEVVAPVVAGTTAGRYLLRRGGDGGYMVILDTDGLARWRPHLAEIGVRIAAPLAIGEYEGAQLHPRDTGGALLEINTTRNGAPLEGPYWPAGPHWQQAMRTERVSAIGGATLQAADPQALAKRWAQILQRSAKRESGEWRVALDNAVLRFLREDDGRGEGLAGIDLLVPDVDAVLALAARRQRPIVANRVDVGGVWFTLTSKSGAA